MSVRVLRAEAIAESGPRTPPPWQVTLRAVVKRGLRDRWRSMLGWGFSLGALDAFMAAIYPTIRTSIEQVASSYPASLREAFGVGAMNTVEGYVHAEMFSLVMPLAVGYFAVRAVAAPLAGAEERGELDTVLSLPLSRWVLAAGACIVMAVTSAGVLALVAVMTFVVGSIAGTGISLGLVIAGCAGVWSLAVFTAGICALAVGALRRSARAAGVAMAVLVAMYALDLAGRLASSLQPLRLVSAFRYYGAPLQDGLDPAAFAGLVVVAALVMAIGAALLERRDIRH